MQRGFAPSLQASYWAGKCSLGEGDLQTKIKRYTEHLTLAHVTAMTAGCAVRPQSRLRRAPLLPVAVAPTSGRSRRLAPGAPCGYRARRYVPDPARES